MTRALNTQQQCEEYLYRQFTRSAAAALPILRRFTYLLNKDIENSDYCIKGYKRKDAIGFCIVKRDSQISEKSVPTNFVVLKPEKRIIDFYHRNDHSSFAITRSFREISSLSDEELESLTRLSFTERAADKSLPVRWKENNLILVAPINSDPILQLGEHPVTGDIEDASENHDQYIYSS